MILLKGGRTFLTYLKGVRSDDHGVIVIQVVKSMVQAALCAPSSFRSYPTIIRPVFSNFQLKLYLFANAMSNLRREGLPDT